MPGNACSALGYCRNITKGTDPVVETRWSLPALNLHFRNRMTSYTHDDCNSSWKLLGATSHLFKFKDCWFPERVSHLNGSWDSDRNNSWHDYEKLSFYLHWLETLLLGDCLRHSSTICRGNFSLPAKSTFQARSQSPQPHNCCLGVLLDVLSWWRVEDPSAKCLGYTLSSKVSCWSKS